MSSQRKLSDRQCVCGDVFHPRESTQRYCSNRCVPKLRKLPAAKEINRLLWIEELTTRQIAGRYGCTMSAVQHAMRTHGIKAVPRRITQCVETDCKKSVCQTKRSINGKQKWQAAIRCYYHQQMHIRRIQREYMRKYRNYRGRKGPALRTTATPSKWIRESA